MLPEAHKKCRFGQWYYGPISKKLNEHSGFIAIEKAHQHMHHLVASLLMYLSAKKTIAVTEYDNFADSLERLRLEIYALRSEIETLLYNRDPLTTLINRISMLPILREQQELSKRQLSVCCLAMVDIDFFKKINDTHGHLVGDKVLVIVAHYFLENIRPYDKIFRFGGEEFLLCMPQLNAFQAFKMVDRLRADIAKIPFNVGLSEPLYLTCSCGIAILDANCTIEESIDHTDKALYSAKSSGRNQTKIWNEAMIVGTN